MSSALKNDDKERGNGQTVANLAEATMKRLSNDKDSDTLSGLTDPYWSL